MIFPFKIVNVGNTFSALLTFEKLSYFYVCHDPWVLLR